MEPTPTPQLVGGDVPLPELPDVPLSEMFKVWAFIGSIFVDLFALVSLIGSFLILINGITNLAFNRKFIETRGGEGSIRYWSLGGLIFGTVTTVLIFMYEPATPIGIILRTDKVTIALLLLGSFLLLVLRVLLDLIKKLTKQESRQI